VRNFRFALARNKLHKPTTAAVDTQDILYIMDKKRCELLVNICTPILHWAYVRSYFNFVIQCWFILYDKYIYAFNAFVTLCL